MRMESVDKTYIQCLSCGHIYTIDRTISFEFSIIKSYCPNCEHTKGLNCGHSEDDVAELKDYFIY